MIDNKIIKRDHRRQIRLKKIRSGKDGKDVRYGRLGEDDN